MSSSKPARSNKRKAEAEPEPRARPEQPQPDSPVGTVGELKKALAKNNGIKTVKITLVEKPRVYFSFDVEADGPSPALNSMVSFGCVVFNDQGKEVDRMQMNIKPEAGKVVDKRCKEEFWDKHSEILAFVQTNPQEPKNFALAIAAIYAKWRLTHKIVWVAKPAAYDWQWLNAYYCRYFEDDVMPNIGHSATCIRTMLEMLRLRSGWTNDEANQFEEEELKKFSAKDHVTHNPEHDARVQGKFFFHLRSLLSA